MYIFFTANKNNLGKNINYFDYNSKFNNKHFKL